MRSFSRRHLCLAVLFALSLHGQDASPKPATIGVTVSEIFDTRASGAQPGDCRLILNLSGDAVADAHSVRRIRVTNARDELGRDLVKPADETGGLLELVSNPTPAEEQLRLQTVAAEVARRRAAREAAQGQLQTMAGVAPMPVPIPTALPLPRPSAPGRPVISLRNPSRQSASIKIVEGEIELFAPTEANGGLLHLDGIVAQPGVFVQHDALQAADVRLMYLTPETYAAHREAARADARDPNSPWSDEFAGQFKAFTATPSAASHRYVAPFFVNDPNRVLVDMELRNKDGQRLDRPAGRINIGHFRSLILEAPPPADAQLIVRIAGPGTVATHPFKLENIPLP